MDLLTDLILSFLLDPLGCWAAGLSAFFTSLPIVFGIRWKRGQTRLFKRDLSKKANK